MAFGCTFVVLSYKSFSGETIVAINYAVINAFPSNWKKETLKECRKDKYLEHDSSGIVDVTFRWWFASIWNRNRWKSCRHLSRFVTEKWQTRRMKISWFMSDRIAFHREWGSFFFASVVVICGIGVHRDVHWPQCRERAKDNRVFYGPFKYNTNIQMTICR